MNKHAADVKVFATVEARDLAKALRPVTFVVERRNTMPILECVKISVDGARMTVEGDDLDMNVVANVDMLDAAGTWSTCVNARMLANIARVAGRSRMRMEPSGDELLIDLDDGAASYRLPAMSAEHFPAVPGNAKRGDLIERFTNGLFAEALGKVRTAISSEETRYYLNGANWAASHGSKWFCATDGHRLIKYSYASHDGADGPARILTKKLVDLVCRHFAGADVSIYAAGDVRLELDFGGIVVVSRIIEGTFPDVHRVIPPVGGNPHAIEAPREALVEALRLVGVAQSHLAGSAGRFFNVDGKLAIEAKNMDRGDARANVDAAFPDKLTDFGLNRQYLSNMLGTCAGRVTLRLKDAGAPVLISDDDESVTRVLMPMRV